MTIKGPSEWYEDGAQPKHAFGPKARLQAGCKRRLNALRKRVATPKKVVHKPFTYINYTVEDVQLMLDLYHEGLYVSEIAIILSERKGVKITKNTIIGHIDRQRYAAKLKGKL